MIWITFGLGVLCIVGGTEHASNATKEDRTNAVVGMLTAALGIALIVVALVLR